MQGAPETRLRAGAQARVAAKPAQRSITNLKLKVYVLHNDVLYGVPTERSSHRTMQDGYTSHGSPFTFHIHHLPIYA